MKTIAERFWSKVDKNGPVHPKLGTRCWLWTAYVKPNGYGGFCWSKAVGMVYTHRAVWDIAGQPLVAGEQSLHRCDVRHCVNYVEHLFKGTQADNLADAGAKGHMGRNVLGTKNPRARLTPEQVAFIRSAHPVGADGKRRRPRGLTKALAEQFGTTPAYIRRLWDDDLWS